MMVSTPTVVNLDPLIAVLQSRTATSESKTETYQTIIGFIKDGDSERFESFLIELVPKIEVVFQCLCEDGRDADAALAQSALQALGFFLYHDDITKNITKDRNEAIIDTLCDVVVETADKSTCTRALWCLSKQTLDTTVVSQKIEKVVNAVEHGQCKKKFQSMAVEHEALNALVRLLSQVPKAMSSQAIKWGPLIYGPLIHSAPMVREKALIAMETGYPYMISCQEELAKKLAADLKAQVLISEMNKMMRNKQESHILKVWKFYVKLLGKALHGGSLINQLLPIVEQGFKNPNKEIKVQSYYAWETLIDNFSMNPDIIGDHKRVKLLMQVFRINNAKFENIAMAKLMVWWHFVVKLGDKAAQYFEQVCVPLLHYCVNGAVSTTGLTPAGRSAKHPAAHIMGNKFGSPSTPHLNVSNNTSSPSSATTFKSVQLKGLEVIAQFIGKTAKDIDNPKPKLSVDELNIEVVSGVNFFLKHHQTLIGAVIQGIISLGDNVEDGMLHYLWNSMMMHMKNVIEATSKKDHGDSFSFFMTWFKDLVESQSLDNVKILKMFQPVVNLPEKALASLAYQIGDSSVLTQGCPALYLIEILFNHRILETSSSEERFFLLLEKLVACGFSNSSSALSFCGTVMERLAHKAGNVESRDGLWRMWSIAAHPLIDMIKKTNEVNQGNNLDHDFSALYTTLTFPVLHILGDQLAQGSVKTLLKTWADLYTTFIRVAAMVTTTDANLMCEEVCRLMLEGIQEADKLDASFLECMIQIMEVMLKQMSFSNIPNTVKSGLLNFGKRKEKAMGNLMSFVSLLDKLLKAIDVKTVDGSLSPQTYTTCASMLSTLFTHIPVPQTVAVVISTLAESSAQVLKGQCTKTQGKTFTTQYNQKLERLWMDIATSLEGRYSGPYDSELLHDLAPLLEVTFLHPRRAIKNQTIIFWNTTFAKERSLEYPDKLKPTLAKVKEKTAIVFPGWDSAVVYPVDDTPLSQMTQGESQVPVPSDLIQVAVSPRKEFGSFLNKNVSPKVKNSPLKTPQSPVGNTDSAKKKLSLKIGLQDMNSKDFVLISTTPKHKRVLTEHQKDMMKEKHADIPAMYSNLDASVDNSLMAQFCTGNTQSESQMDTSTPTIDITPFPFMKPANPPPATKSDQKESNKEQPPQQRKSARKSLMSTKLPAAPIATDKAEPPVKNNDIDTPVRRRRSVRFSDELDTSSESVSDDTATPKSTGNKAASAEQLKKSSENIGQQKSVELVAAAATNEVVSDSDTSIDETGSSTSRTSRRIKERQLKQKQQSTEKEKDGDSEKQEEENDSVMIIENSELVNDVIVINSSQATAFNESTSAGVEDSNSTQNDKSILDITEMVCKSASSSSTTKKIDSENCDNYKTPTTVCDISANTENKGCENVSRDAIVSPNSVHPSFSTTSFSMTSTQSTEVMDSNSQTMLRTSPKASDESNVDSSSPSSPPRKKTRGASLRSKSPAKSPGNSLKSPKKFISPRKAISLEGYSTLDKWFKKSSTTIDVNTALLSKEDQENNSVLTSSQKSKLSTLFAQETTNDGIPSVRKVQTVQPIIMAEESQQFSPSKFKKNASNEYSAFLKTGEKDQPISVEETPLKEIDNCFANKEGLGVRSLHGALDTSPRVIPDSEIVVPDSQFSTADQNEINVSPDLLDSITDCHESHSTVAPVLKLRKLSDTDIFKHSPSKVITKEVNNENIVSKNKLEKTLSQDDLDDIIPSSQDSFGISLRNRSSYNSQESGSNSSASVRPFALFSSFNKSPQKKSDRVLEEVDAAMECEDLKEVDKTNSISDTQPFSDVLDPAQVNSSTKADAKMPQTLDKNMSDDVKNVTQNSEDSLSSSQITQGKKRGRPRKSVTNDSQGNLAKEKSDSVSSETSQQKDSNATILSDDTSDSSNHLHKRKVATPKRFNRAAFRKAMLAPTLACENDADKSSQSDSELEIGGRDKGGRRKKGREDKFCVNIVSTIMSGEIPSQEVLFSSCESEEGGTVVKKDQNNDKDKDTPPKGNKKRSRKISPSSTATKMKISSGKKDNSSAKSTDSSCDDMPLSQLANRKKVKQGASNATNNKKNSACQQSGSSENIEENIFPKYNSVDNSNTSDKKASSDKKTETKNKKESVDSSEDDVPISQILLKKKDSVSVPFKGQVLLKKKDSISPSLSPIKMDSVSVPLSPILLKKKDSVSVPLSQILLKKKDGVSNDDGKKQKSSLLLQTQNSVELTKDKMDIGVAEHDDEISSTPPSQIISSSQNSSSSVPSKKRLSNLLTIDMKTSPIGKKLRSNKPILRGRVKKRNDNKLKLKKKKMVVNSSPRRRALSEGIKKRNVSRQGGDGCDSNISQKDVPDVVQKGDDLVDKVEGDSSNKEKINEGSDLLQYIDSQESQEAKKLETPKDTSVDVSVASEKPEKLPLAEKLLGKEYQSEDPIPSPVKFTDNIGDSTKMSPQKILSVRASPPKKGKPFDMPETPTSSMSKCLGMTRADYIMQKSRLLLGGRQSYTPSPSVRRIAGLKDRACFSEPRKGLKRILKKSPGNDATSSAASPEKDSGFESSMSNKNSSPPQRQVFRPVNLPRIYSPSASPSAGILKRRRVTMDESPVNSPSPPNKQRRVSFAESVETRLYERPKSRLVGRPSSPRPVSRCLDMPKNVQSPLVTAEQQTTQQKTAGSQWDSQPTQTPDSVKSTAESQLDCKDPIFPELLNCEVSVDEIVGQLTTSVWSRGLGQLVRSRNITTIGHLSALTEYEVNNLPIRSPKIATLKEVLRKFADSEQNLPTTTKSAELGEVLDSSMDSDLGVLETSIDLLDEIKQLDTSTCSGSVFETSTIETGNNAEIRGSSSNKVTTDSEKKIGSKKTDTADKSRTLAVVKKKNTSAKSGDFEKKLKRQSIINGIKSIKELVSEENLKELPTHSLLQIQMELNSLMTNVTLALHAKVPLSPNSESSQE